MARVNGLHAMAMSARRRFVDLFKQMNERVDDDELWRVSDDRPPGI
jgi:hypothetical protein